MGASGRVHAQGRRAGRGACAAVACAACAVASADVVFVDVTPGSGLDGFSHAPNYLATPGTNEWILSGVGVGDFNGDGWPDVLALRGGTGADRLYLNNGNGAFTNLASAWGVAATHAGNGVACGDFDRDGDLDLYVTSYGSGTDNFGQLGRNRLYRNDGDRFTDVAAAMGVQYTSYTFSCGDSAAWGDLDLDGDLDLAVAGWSPSAAANRLYRNDGGGFTDLTGGAIAFPSTWGFTPSFADLTGDGFPELLYAADFETSRGYRNARDGTFVLATQAMGLGLDDNGMGACLADFDRNGALDYYVTSVHMAVPNAGMYNGNCLYMNHGEGAFSEEALVRGASDGGWGWGAVAGDFDHDGWEDLVEVNGRNSSEWANEPEYVYRNLGGGTFARLGPESGISLAADARCVATLDYDRDGDLDLLMFVNSGAMKLFRNDSTSGTRHLVLDLVASGRSRCAPNGIGAVVECVVARGKQKSLLRRWVQSGNGFHASSEPIVHFGFGAKESVESLRILWPSGQTTAMGPVSAGQRLRIEAPAAADVDADGAVGAGDLALLLGAWGATDRADRAMRAADLDLDGAVGAGDLSILLGAWGTVGP